MQSQLEKRLSLLPAIFKVLTLVLIAKTESSFDLILTIKVGLSIATTLKVISRECRRKKYKIK
jgi:hypothetical protein